MSQKSLYKKWGGGGRGCEIQLEGVSEQSFSNVFTRNAKETQTWNGWNGDGGLAIIKKLHIKLGLWLYAASCGEEKSFS